MVKFTDDDGRTWEVRITAAEVMALKRTLGFKMFPIGEAALAMSQDIELLVNVIYVCCRAQAEAAAVTDEQFGRSLRNSIKPASDALLEAMTDFLALSDRKFPQRLLVAIDSLPQPTNN